jgi:hypothetical protein
LIAALAPGTHARLKLLRDKSETEVTVTVGKRPKLQPQKP